MVLLINSIVSFCALRAQKLTIDKCHNTDAWESEAAFNAFGSDRLGPAVGKLGINVMPEVTFNPHRPHDLARRRWCSVDTRYGRYLGHPANRRWQRMVAAADPQSARS